jgi:hypothetical protein
MSPASQYMQRVNAVASVIRRAVSEDCRDGVADVAAKMKPQFWEIAFREAHVEYMPTAIPDVLLVLRGGARDRSHGPDSLISDRLVSSSVVR